uniref:Uncharacterized protein n=1 Tax=Meloidogyne enterolobii TaxID=390850 RepID=A0A6V7VFM1_MELEN|nr:unnamed protein product [Meloidogyne enterolobii]
MDTSRQVSSSSSSSKLNLEKELNKTTKYSLNNNLNNVRKPFIRVRRNKGKNPNSLPSSPARVSNNSFIGKDHINDKNFAKLDEYLLIKSLNNIQIEEKEVRPKQKRRLSN